MNNCSCKRIYNYMEFELESEKILLSEENNYLVTSTYINNDKKLKLFTIFEPNFGNKNEYFASSEVTYISSKKESNNTIIESIVNIPNIDEYKDKIHELLSTYLYNSVITSNLIKNIIGNDIKDIIKVLEINTFSIKLWGKNNKKYASITISSLER